MKVGDWVTTPLNGGYHPAAALGAAPPQPITGQILEILGYQYRISWPDDPLGLGHRWTYAARPATPEEIATAQLAGLEGGL